MSLEIFVFITFSVLGIVSSVFVTYVQGIRSAKWSKKKYPKHSTYYYNLPNDSLLTMKNLNLAPIGHLAKSLNHIVERDDEKTLILVVH